MGQDDADVGIAIRHVYIDEGGVHSSFLQTNTDVSSLFNRLEYQSAFTSEYPI